MHSTTPPPITARAAARQPEAYPATPESTDIDPNHSGPLPVQRLVSSSGGLMLTRQHIQLEQTHARKVATVTVTVDETTIQLHHKPELLATIGRTTTKEATRHQAQNH